MWRIYYADGSTHDGRYTDAPPFGVVVIVQSDQETGRSLWKDCDYYWWVGDCWVGGDFAGLIDHLAHNGRAKVIFGRTVPDSVYRGLISRALNDSDFPRKSARHPREGTGGQARKS